MNLFSKNNYKYFIIFLIVFIFIILIYGNYNFQINIIENSQNMMTDPTRCSTKTSVNTDNFSEMSAPGAISTVSAAANLICKLNVIMRCNYN